MIFDTIGVGDGKTGTVSEIKLAPVKAQEDLLTPEERKFYATYSQPDFNSPLPWAEGPRRMGTDKNAEHPLDRRFMGRQPRPHRHP